MAYRKIEQRTWSDEKYLALSRPLPNARDLWIHLMAGPYTTSLPGLLHVGQLALAEDLEWLPEQLPEPFREQFLERFGERSPLPFLQAFAELENAGMAKANWGKRIIWLPNAARYNMPANPNVVKGWKVHWDQLPQCTLKDEAFEGLRAALTLKPKCLKEFDRTFGNRLPNRSETVSGTVCQTVSAQEQEQEQEQEQDITPLKLTSEWLVHRRGVVTSADAPEGLTEVFAEMIRQGVAPEAIRDEIRRSGRTKTEPVWELQKRLCPSGGHADPVGKFMQWAAKGGEG